MIIIFQYYLHISDSIGIFAVERDGTLTNSRGTTVCIFPFLLVFRRGANCNTANNIVALYTGYWIIASTLLSQNESICKSNFFLQIAPRVVRIYRYHFESQIKKSLENAENR